MNRPQMAQENQCNYMDFKIYIFLIVTRDVYKIIQLHLKMHVTIELAVITSSH